MPVYRFYALSCVDEAPIQSTFFNDQVAMGWAFRMTDAGGVEVWQGSRFVARLHAGVPPDPPEEASRAAPADRDDEDA